VNNSTLRVARIGDGEHAGRWGLWSDAHQRWAGVLYVAERHATEALQHLSHRATCETVPD
jgi:hypothetical protein